MFRTTFEKDIYESYDYMHKIEERVSDLKEQLKILEVYLKRRGL